METEPIWIGSTYCTSSRINTLVLTQPWRRVCTPEELCVPKKNLKLSTSHLLAWFVKYAQLPVKHPFETLNWVAVEALVFYPKERHSDTNHLIHESVAPLLASLENQLAIGE